MKRDRRSAFIHYQTVLDFENLDYDTVDAGLQWEF